MSLLPKDHEQFRSKAYWDEFFQKRGEQSFEWYGNFNEVSPILKTVIEADLHILITGCGNSDFSSDLYDQGCKNITSMDFSELVIEQMKNKNLSRPEMKWDVADMTAMIEYSDASFDVVFDKGSLDALMSVDSIETKMKAISMFHEISRVLTLNGKYICITLAENFIAETLFDFFFHKMDSNSWEIHIKRIEANKPSPFVPFFIIISKTHNTTQSIPIKLYVDNFGKNIDKPIKTQSISETMERINQIQGFHRKQFQLKNFEQNRFECIPFYSKEFPDIPRFTVYVLDHNPTAARSCAVFMVPFGREADFQFTSVEGLRDIADQAQCQRLLSVCCNRPHQFPEMAELQSELSPLVLTLTLGSQKPEESIPYMALGTENSWDEVEKGDSPDSGLYVVEQLDDEENENRLYRRLIFLQNQNFVQTEVRLISNTTKSQQGKGKKGKGNKGSKTSIAWEFDFSYLDDHHRAALAALVFAPNVINLAKQVENPTKHIGSDINPPRAVLVGLGGGALPMCLQRYLPGLHLTVCDTDKSLPDIAKRHFGFKCNSRTQVETRDGIELIRELHAGLEGSSSLGSGKGHVDLIFIDADSKNASLGISAPPEGFVTEEFLRVVYETLRPEGLLLLNVVARSLTMREALIRRISDIFTVDHMNDKGDEMISAGKMYKIQASKENVNVTVIAKKGKVCKNSKIECVMAMDKKERENIFENWLTSIRMTSDPLKICDIGILIQEC